MTQLKGADISDYQGQPDFDKLKEAVDFVLTKATEGVGFMAQTLNRNKAEMRRVGLQHGFYHFARGGDSIAEADYFVDQIGDYHKGELLMLDWEIEHVDPARWCLPWLQRVEARTGTKPLIYMNLSTAHAYDWSPVVQNENGLVIASYGAIDDGLPHDAPDSAQWPFLAIWQYTSRGAVNGITVPVDLDIFYGDAAALARYGGADLASALSQPDAAHGPATLSGLESYTVRPGDSMSAVAQRFGISLPELERANPQIHNPNLIHVGEMLHIPNGKQPSGPPVNAGNMRIAPSKAEILKQLQPVLDKYHVPWPLVAAIIQVESDWKVRALGDGGTSYGLFQLHVPGGQGDIAIREGHRPEDLYDPRLNARYAMPSIDLAWDALKSSFDPSSISWWLAFAAASGHPGGSSTDPATIHEARALQAAYTALNGPQGRSHQGPPLKRTREGEIAEFAEVDQFVPGKTQFACGFFACAMALSMAPVGQPPTLTPQQIIGKAEEWYLQFKGEDNPWSQGGLTTEEEYRLLHQIGLHYQETANDINVVERWIEAGYPALISVVETSVFDLDLGCNPYTAFTPKGLHMILATGVTSDGNVLCRDSASCTNLGDPNTLRPGPRKYKAANLQLYSAVVVVPPWLPRPASGAPPALPPQEIATMVDLSHP